MVAAFGQGVRLDAVLLVGLLGAGLSSGTAQWDVYGLILASGLGKSVLGGVFAAIRCAATVHDRTHR